MRVRGAGLAAVEGASTFVNPSSVKQETFHALVFFQAFLEAKTEKPADACVPDILPNTGKDEFQESLTIVPDYFCGLAVLPPSASEHFSRPSTFGASAD